MKYRNRTLRTIGLLGAATVIAAGCGGGDDATAPTTPAPTPTPTPSTGANGAVVGDPGAGGATGAMGGTGTGAEPAPAATAEIPDLSGGNVGGGLSAPSGGDGLFTAQASEGGASAPSDPSVDSGLGGGFPPSGTPLSSQTPDTSSPEPPKPEYGSAKIYVDGVVHTVGVNETFPKAAPVFRLTEISGGSIELELIAGEFTSGGGDGVLLDKGELVSLVNASEQLTYRVKFMRPISGSSGITM